MVSRQLEEYARAQNLNLDDLVAQVRERCRHTIMRRSDVDLEGILRLSGIELGLSDEEVQECYARRLADDDLRIVQWMMPVLGAPPSQKTIDAWYIGKIDEKFWMHRLEEWKSAIKTGFRPSEEAILKGYQHLLDTQRGGLDVVFDMTGVKVPEAMVQNTYAQMFKEQDFYAMERLFRETGLRAAVPDGIVQAAYRTIFDSEYSLNRELQFVFDMTGITPDLSGEEVNAKYRVLAQHGRADSMQALHAVTKVEPALTDEDVQEGYRGLLLSDCSLRFEDVRLFKTVTGVSPSEEVSRAWYEKQTGIGYGHASMVNFCREITGRDPPDTLFKSMLEYFIKGR